MNYSKVFKESRTFLFIVIAALAFQSCEKPEGVGGTSSIKGVISEKAFNDDYSMIVSNGPAIDEEVFIMYGEDAFLGDRVFTSISGSFMFQYLRAGKYTLYYSSEDSTTLNREETMVEMEIDLKDGEALDLGELFQLETKDYDDGSAKISGIIELVNYKNSSVYPFLEMKDVSLAQNENVYLIYGDHKQFDGKVDTGKDGYFEFADLIPGEYEIYVYSEDVSGGTEDIPVVRKVSISDTEEAIDLGVITIEQL